MNKSRHISISLSGLSLVLATVAGFVIAPRAFTQSGACTTTPISVGQTVTGSLSASDCRSLVRGDAYFADRYSFSASAGAQIAVTLSSSDFDTYLYLIGPAGSVLAQDDDGAGGSNSRIPAGSGLLTLAASGVYVLEITSYSADRTGGYALSLSLQPAGCAYAIAPTSQTFPASGGSGSVSVTAGSGCAWQTFKTADWIAITAGGSGTGSGAVGYAVAANPGIGPRTATLIIAGQSLTVTQAGCVAIAPASQSFNPAGGNGSISVMAASNCNWTAASNSGFITIVSGADGSGNGTINYTVAANTGFTARTGTITITGQLFTITQAGLVCPAAPISAGQTVTGALSANDCRSAVRGDAYFADRYSFTASAGSQIAITLSSSEFDTYLYLIGPAGSVLAQDDDGVGGSNSRIPAGNGFLTLPASGVYVVEVTSYSLNHAGGYALNLSGESPSCNYSIAPQSQSFAAAGGTGSVNVTVAAGCVWTASSNDNWITITSGMGGNGNGVVNYTVTANANASLRSGTVAIAGQTLTITQAGAAMARTLRVVSSSGAPGSVVSLGVELAAQGDENALGFSLSFDPAMLSFTRADLGSGATAAVLNLNANQTAQGRLGVTLALPAGQKFVAGTRQLLTVSLMIAANAPAGALAVGFADQPVSRATVDVSANLLPTNYVSGVVTVTLGYEADVAPRPNGSNNGTVTISDWVLVGRFAAGLDTPDSGSEFQRADCAPKNTLGDGRLTIADWVQAGRYAAGLDPIAAAGGPMMPNNQLAAVIHQLQQPADNERSAADQPRTLRLATSDFVRGRSGTWAVELDARGDENALGFSLHFDPAQLRFINAALGSAPTNLTFTINQSDAAQGRLGFALALPPGQTLSGSTHQLLLVTFAAFSDASPSEISLEFTDQPTAREVVDAEANVLPASFEATPPDREKDESNKPSPERVPDSFQVSHEQQWKGYFTPNAKRRRLGKEEDYVVRRNISDRRIQTAN